MRIHEFQQGAQHHSKTKIEDTGEVHGIISILNDSHIQSTEVVTLFRCQKSCEAMFKGP